VIFVKRNYIYLILESMILWKNSFVTQHSKNTQFVLKGSLKVWKGPSDGISQSLISKFLECPFRFYLYAIKGVKDDQPPNLNLIWGNAFHKALETVLKHSLNSDKPRKLPGDDYLLDVIKKDIEKCSEDTQVPNTIPFSILEMVKLYPLPQEIGEIIPEQVFTYEYELNSGRKVKFRGKADGLGPTCIVEHKCKGKFDAIQTLKETMWDMQTNLYCYVFGKEKVIYDLIRIPEAQYNGPKCRIMEDPKDFVYRIYNNYCGTVYPIKRFKKHWIDQLHIDLPFSQQLKVMDECIIPLCERIYDWYEYVTHPNFDIENPVWYNSLFYRTPVRHFDPSKTEHYKCSYWDYLVGDQELDCMIPVTSYYTELEEE